MPDSGGPDEVRSGRGWMLKSIVMLLMLVSVFIAGLFLRPLVESKVFSDEEARRKGSQMAVDVKKAIGEVEERQRQEVVRLGSFPAPGRSMSGDVIPASHLAEWNRLSALLKDLYVFRESLRVAESGGYRAEVVQTLEEPIREKLAAVEAGKPKLQQ